MPNWLQPPTATDAIAAIANRVSTLEAAQYNDNTQVVILKQFTENTQATEQFTLSNHQYNICSTTLLCSNSLMI